nr:hypothetical protein [Acholeplasmatales bacterium]
YILLNSNLFDNFIDKKEYYLNKLKNELMINIFKLVKMENLKIIYENEKIFCIKKYNLSKIYKDINGFIVDMNI